MQEQFNPNTDISVPSILSLLGICILLCYLVVVMTRLPRTTEEWVVSLVTTVIGSIAGGASVVMYFNLQHYINSWFGLCVLGGVIFTAGLPFWAIARWTFNYIHKKENADITEIITDIKTKIKG